MTREELKEHCKRQIQQFERVKEIMPVTPNDWKRYEEHKLVLELLEQEPKTGHWIEQIDHEENCRTLICSNCDRAALHDGDSIWKHKFCPHCGARMVEPQESEET